MSVVNTGQLFNSTLYIDVLKDGVHSKYETFNIFAAFSSYPALTEQEIRYLTNEQFDARQTAFKSYVQSEMETMYPGTGFTVTTVSGRQTNLSLCPLP